MYGCVDLEMRDRRVVDMGFRGLDALSFLLCTSSMRFWLCFLLFSHHRYSPSEKLLSVFVFISGLSLRWISERLSITHASRESVRIWKDSFRKLKERTKRIYNNVNTKSVKNVEETAKAITLLHNIITQTRSLGGVILT